MHVDLALVKREMDIEDARVKLEPQDDLPDGDVEVLSGKPAMLSAHMRVFVRIVCTSMGVAVLLRTIPLTFNSCEFLQIFSMRHFENLGKELSNVNGADQEPFGIGGRAYTYLQPWTRSAAGKYNLKMRTGA